MHNFEANLSACAARINAHLALIIDTDLLGGGRHLAVPRRLAEAMQHAVLGGGKRFRPFLTLETARLFGCREVDALDAAAAIELLHCYSLVHDDLPAMDNDVLRRGLPTVHVAYGEATAILAGDALQTLAFEVISRASGHEPAVGLALVQGLAAASGAAGMAGGQQLDMQAESAPAALTIAELGALQAMKTGAIIAFAVDAGALLGAAAPAERASLAAYARSLGLAFQIADDLLDVDATAAELGKTPGKDQAAGKSTFVSLLGVAGARARLAAVEAEAIAALAPLGRRADVLADAARFVSRRRH